MQHLITCLKCGSSAEVEIVETSNGPFIQYKDLKNAVVLRGKNKGMRIGEIISARMRFDGHWGFQCLCGNNSLLATAEEGYVTHINPTKEGLDKIMQNLREEATKVEMTSQGKKVDNFVIGAI